MSPFVQKIIEHHEGMHSACERIELLTKTIKHHERSIEVLSQDLNDDEKKELAEWEKANMPKPAEPAAPAEKE